MSHQCPVCGFTGLVAPPADFEICPCCGTEFGYDDDQKSHAHLRAEWIDNRTPWFSRANPPPRGWDPIAQLIQAGYLSVAFGDSNAKTRPTVIVFGEPFPQLCASG